MKAISLWQPWASLWCSPAKRHETRKFSTKHRGWIAVHAAKHEASVDADVHQVALDHFESVVDLPRGAIVGCVYLVGCYRVDDLMPHELGQADRICGDWRSGRFAWRRSEFVLLPRAIPYRGQQGWFEVPDEHFERYLK